ELANTFVRSARLAYEIGFDGVDIKCCNGYLGADMLSARTRKGIFGGDFKNRTRFILSVVDRVRKSTNTDFLIAIRLGLYDGVPYPFGWGTSSEDTAVPDFKEPLALLKALEEHGVSLVSISNGVPEISSHLIRPADRPVLGGELPPWHPLESIDLNVRSFKASKKVVPGIKYVGSSLSWLRRFLPNVAAALIEHDYVDMIGLGRMSFAYPEFMRDLTSKGVLNAKSVCVACTMCTQLLIWDKQTGCVVRDKEYYGRLYKETLEKILKKNIN
ncbi:MAG: flavin oxidoreductase/NADH oxidase, partial [Spirochaetota bacterium]|nr:flavin oxidoreductase/NADH oxidase [Spirochaetota bacterium]